MLTRGKRRILFWLSVAVFLALVPVTVLYSLGYRFDRNFVLRKTGGLYIASDVSGSEIFINGELERRTNLLQSGVFVQNLAPNKYKVLVAREGYLGWSKELQIFSRFVSEARAVLVPAETNGKIILKGRFSGLGGSPDSPWLFPKRRDVLIAAFDNGVWAVELDGHGGRGSYPIYKGKEPDFALLAGDDVLYVLGDGNLIRVSLLAAE